MYKMILTPAELTSFATRQACSREWTGATANEIAERRACWPEIAGRIADLPGINAPISTGKRVKIWSDYDGDEWSPERAQDERPCLRRRVKRPERGHKRGKIKTLAISLGLHGGIRPDAILWTTYAATKYIDELEAQGYRLEVLISCKTERQARGYPLTLTTIRAKSPEETLNLGKLATLCAPWALRCWLFGYWEAHFKSNLSKGYGAPRPIEKTDFPEIDESDLIILNGSEVTTQKAATDWLKKQETERTQ